MSDSSRVRGPEPKARACGYFCHHLRPHSIASLTKYGIWGIIAHPQMMGVGVVSESGSEQECRAPALVLFVFSLAVPGGPVLQLHCHPGCPLWTPWLDFGADRSKYSFALTLGSRSLVTPQSWAGFVLWLRCNRNTAGRLRLESSKGSRPGCIDPRNPARRWRIPSTGPCTIVAVQLSALRQRALRLQKS